MNRIIYFIAIALIGLVACKGNENKENASQENAATENVAGADSTAIQQNTYTCPMHPEVNSDKEGVCPHCGMELEVKS